MTTAELISIRRKIHQNPELGYREFETAKLIAGILSANNISYETNVADTGTGIGGKITKGAGKTVLLRADIDALPLTENSGVPFSSLNENMHACGHDVHTVMLLGALTKLNRDDSFSGTVKFIFQPSEESVKGDAEGKSGGQRIAESDFLNDVGAALALHLHPQIPAGKLAYTQGSAVAYASFFQIEITGTSSHAGASPQLANDTIIAATKLVADMQTIISRNIQPGIPAVISVTMINAGTAENIIADNVVMKGTIRALDHKIYRHIIDRINDLLRGIEIAFHVKTGLTITVAYPNLENNAEVHKNLLPAITEVFGTENLVKIPPLMIGEDFAFYSKKVPCMFYYLGAQVDSLPYFLHDNRVIFNEDCIHYGVDFLAQGAKQLLL